MAQCLSQYDYKGQKLDWSVKNTEAAFYIKAIEKKDIETTVLYVWKGQTEGQYNYLSLTMPALRILSPAQSFHSI